MNDEEKIVSIPVPGADYSVRAPVGAWEHVSSLGDTVDVRVGDWDNGYALRISRDMAIMYGIVEATPEERAALDAESARWKARREAYEQSLVTFMETLGEFIKRDSAALRAVAEQHRRSEPGKYHIDEHICATCTEIAYDEDSVEYPCSVIRTIAKTYGIEVPTL